ncbi:MAG: GMC family oxidoreductase [Thermoleophilia bacterium]
MIEDYEYLVVGSGAGGSAVARELALAGKRVGVLERGRAESRRGTFRDALRFYDSSPLLHLPRRSREGVPLYRTFMGGGTTEVSCGNLVRCLEKELAQLGIALERELGEIEAEAGVSPLPSSLISSASRAIAGSARELGLAFVPMPKGIDATRCTGCGNCLLGCKRRAKWTAGMLLDQAVAAGAEIHYSTSVTGVATEHGRIQGVTVRTPAGTATMRAGCVVLAAGGLESPALLRRAGLTEAGRHLFADLFVNTYALLPETSPQGEPQMSLVCRDLLDEEGFLLSPFFPPSRLARLVEAPRAARLPAARGAGIMTKIKDVSVGSISSDGGVSKAVHRQDERRLETGAGLAARILGGAGALPGSLLVTRAQGAHPGGGAAVGSVVDQDLQTRIDNLFVCDASVLPVSPGAPPILTITALGRRLGRFLANQAPVSSPQ